jgi:hypothetical protein
VDKVANIDLPKAFLKNVGRFRVLNTSNLREHQSLRLIDKETNCTVATFVSRRD